MILVSEDSFFKSISACGKLEPTNILETVSKIQFLAQNLWSESWVSRSWLLGRRQWMKKKASNFDQDASEKKWDFKSMSFQHISLLTTFSRSQSENLHTFSNLRKRLDKTEFSNTTLVSKDNFLNPCPRAENLNKLIHWK